MRDKTRTAWREMIYRCHRVSHPSFKDYGERGITVCKEWHDYENFLRDMGEVPEGFTLDRIDNDKGYFKENCRWTTRTVNLANRRSWAKIARGVQVSDYGLFKALITIDKKTYYIGCFKTAEEAHQEFLKVKEEWYGKSNG